MNKTQMYDGPKLYIRLEPTQVATKLNWHVKLAEKDATGTRSLGYQAAGIIDKLGNVTFEMQPQVHDEFRDVWTTMNLTDRPDLRKRMMDLVLRAKSQMEKDGQSFFEKKVP